MKYIFILLIFLSLLISCTLPVKKASQRPVAKFDPLDTSTKSPYKEYNKAISLDSNNKTAYDSRAHAKYKDTDYAGAMSDYKIALFIDSNDAYALAGIGITYHHYYRDYENALKYYDKSIKRDSTVANNFYNRSVTKMQLKDYTGALADVNKAIQLGSADADSYCQKGCIEYKLNKYPESLEDLTMAISKDSMYSSAYVNRGNAKYMMNDYDGALEDYDKCLSINPKSSGAFTGIGLVKAKLNKQ